MNIKPERKSEIIDAALRLIGKKGIQNLTTKNLALEVGITEPGLYRHFRNKEDLLAGILGTFRSTISESMKSIMTGSGSPVEKIGTLYLDRLRHFEGNPSLAAVIFSEEIFQNSRKLSKEVFSILEMSREGLELLIREGIQKREIPGDVPTAQLALIIMGAFRMLVKRWRLSGRAFELEKEGLVLWRTLKSLMGINTGTTS
jgi:TetR/AcrR family transcriptional regulator, fatty acid metabolism regulator protein